MEVVTRIITIGGLDKVAHYKTADKAK